MALFGNLIKSVREYIAGSTPPYVLGQASKTGLNPEYSDQFLIDNDENWPYICSRIVASAVAQTPIRLFVTRSTGQQRARTRTGIPGKTIAKSSSTYHYLKNHPYIRTKASFNGADEIEEIFDHPVLDLLKTVNEDQNGFESMYLTSVYMDLTGDAYWYLDNGPMGIPEKMYILLSQHTKIVPGTTELIKGYLYGTQPSNMQAFDPSEVIHYKWPNPENPYYGKGCLEPIIRSAMRDRKMDNLETAILENGGTPKALIGYKQKMTESDRKSLQGDFDRMVRRGNRANGIMITSHEPSLINLGQSLSDMAFPQGRKYNRDQCANSFGVPISMLESGDFGRANFEASLFGFAKFTLRPKLTLIDQKMNEKLIPHYDGADRLIICFDNPVPEDVTQNLSIENQRLTTGVITPNEVRLREGLDPRPGGDIPLTELKLAMSMQPGKKAYEIKADKPLPSDDPSREFPGAISGGHNGKLTKTEAGLAKEAEKFIDDYNDEMVGVLRRATTVPMMLSLSEGGLVSGNLLNELTINFADAALPWLADGFIRGGQLGQEKLGLNVSMWIEQPEAVEAMRKRSMKFASEVYSSKENAIKNVLIDAEEKGLSVDEVTKKISEKVGPDATRAQSERIARTELSKAEHRGTIKLWKDTGIVKAKRWNAENDGCPFCLDMGGKTLGLDEDYFTVDGPNQFVEFRGREIELKHEFDDVGAPPLHPNCVVPETDVVCPELIGATKAHYNGNLYRIKLSNGRSLTVTPNHMLVGENGFIMAQDIRKGTNLVYSPLSEGVISGDPYIDHVPSRIDEVFVALSESSSMSTACVPVSPEYLHSDGEFCEGNIHIVGTDRLLRDAIKSAGIKETNRLNFNGVVGRDAFAFDSLGLLAECLNRYGSASGGNVGRFRESLAILGAGRGHAVEHRLRAIAGLDPIGYQSAIDNLPTTSKSFGKCLDGFSGVVELNEVVDVDVVSYSGHVYDLQSKSTLYTANGVLSSNCRCTIDPVLYDD